MSDDDLLQSLVSGDPQSSARVQAIVQQLRQKGNLADLAQMSGDTALAPFGARVAQQNQQNEVELSRNAMQNRQDDIRQGQLNRQLQQGQDTLAETIRYHNMEDQERKDRLKQQKELKSYTGSNQATIDKIGNYDLPMPTSRTDHNLAIIDAVAQQYPDYDATKYGMKQKAQQAFGSGKLGDLSRSADVSIQHLDTADQKALQLQNSNFPGWNAIRNTVGPMVGNTGIAKQVAGFDTAKSIVADEVNKFIIGGGGALADRQLLQDKLKNATSAPALKEVTDTLRTLMAGQLKGLQGQFVNSGLGKPEDFLSRFQPRTLAALSLVDQPQGGALPGAMAATQGPPGTGSGPPGSAVPGPQGAGQNAISAPAVAAPKRVKVDAQGNIIG